MNRDDNNVLCCIGNLMSALCCVVLVVQVICVMDAFSGVETKRLCVCVCFNDESESTCNL